MRIFLGNKHTVSVPEGYELRAERRVNGTPEQHIVTAGAVGAEFRPSDLGRYYLATREDENSDWRPAGLLEVVSLVNDGYEAACSELDAMNAVLRNEGNLNSLVQWQVTTPDGTSVTRMTVQKAHERRALLEARKVAFERTFSGRMPVRFN